MAGGPADSIPTSPIGARENMIKIVCKSCQKPLSLDETKLPMKEVSFPCPACKATVVVDRRTLEGAPAAGASSASVAPSSGAVAAGAKPSPQRDEEHEGFGAKALLVGLDDPGIRHAAKLIGYIPVHVSTALEARECFNVEFPPMVLLNPAQITPPPLEAMGPIIGVAPVDRRKAFYVLFSDSLRTLDGNAAFLYGVNLVVAHRDLGAFQTIFKEAWGYHERLYGAMNAAAKAPHV